MRLPRLTIEGVPSFSCQWIYRDLLALKIYSHLRLPRKQDFSPREPRLRTTPPEASRHVFATCFRLQRLPACNAATTFNLVAIATGSRAYPLRTVTLNSRIVDISESVVSESRHPEAY